MMQQLLLELGPSAEPTFETYFPARNAAVVKALLGALEGWEKIVYLWGESGTGRSHLLRAAVRAARESGRIAHYADASGSAGSIAPRCDVLAVDNAGDLNENDQSALFDAYNAMRLRGGVVVAAGAVAPGQLPIRPDLRTRIGSGVSLRLVPMSDAEKSAALSEHAARLGLPLGEELLRYILRHCKRDMGTQIAVLNALDRYSLEHKRPATIPLLRDALRRMKP